MDASSIINIIREILPSVRDPQEITDYDPDSSDFLLPRMHRVTVDGQELNRLASALRSLHEIARLEGGIAHPSPGSQFSPIKVEQFAEWLLAQSRFRAPEDCLAELMGAVRSNSSPVLEVIPIWGISPIQRIDLPAGMTVIPIDSLPASRLKDLLTGKRRHKFSFDFANSSPRPGAAIVYEHESGPMYEPRDSETARRSDEQSTLMLAVLTSPSEEGKRDAMKKLAEMMAPRQATQAAASPVAIAEELCAVIALLTPKPIIPLGHWYQRPSNVPLVGPLGGWSGPTNDHPFYIAVDKQDYRSQAIADLVRCYQELDSSMRKRLRVPLVRLNQSRRNIDHHTVEAAAIDLGIALEALLTLDRDHNAPISYLLRVRGALLLGGDAEIKRRNYGVLREAYDLRSKVVHKGTIADLKEIATSREARDSLREARDQITAGHSLCATLLIRLIEMGRFPDWDFLVLGMG